MIPTSQDPEVLLKEVQAARLLSVSTRTLQAWRGKGFGPLFVRVGRSIRYRIRDLHNWLDQRSSQIAG